MDQKGESHLEFEILAEKCKKLKKDFSEQKKLFFFDLLIDCGSIILPAHRFVLCSRNEFLAQQLSPDVNELNWTEYGSDFGIAFLRWIYTNKASSNNVTHPNSFFNWLFETSQVEIDDQASTNSHGCDAHIGVDTEIDLAEEVKKLEKISIGCREFGTFSDLTVKFRNGSNWPWPAHKYFLSNRNTKIRDKISDANDNIIYCKTPAFLRWLYTDVLELESVDTAIDMLYISRNYKLTTLFQQCEEASLKKVDTTSCVRFLEIATVMGTMKILKRCQELIKYYGKVLQSDGSLKMKVDFDNSGENSICEKETCELPLEEAGGLLNLHDDCLFQLFRYLRLVDLGSIKETCKRLSQLVDKSFKLRKDKSITIEQDSMLADIWNLTHFGKLMDSLTIKSIYVEFASFNEIFQMIAKYSNEQLKSFTAPVCNVTDESLQCLEKVLKNVETINLFSIDNSGHIDLLLGYCENLRDVDIVSHEPLRLEVKPIWCSKNVNITCLALNYLQDDQILVEICEKLPHLECLEFSLSNFSRNNMSCLSQLDHLKRLKIGCKITTRIGNVLQKFAEENHLEYLCLSNVIICEELAQTLGHFENLKELVFECALDFLGNSKNILSKSVANVEKIAFVDCHVNGFGQAYKFGDFTQIVENLLNLKELSVIGYSDRLFIDSNNYLRLTKNRNRDLEIFLKDSLYKKSIECIANDLSKCVRVTAKPIDFFDKLCCPKVMN